MGLKERTDARMIKPGSLVAVRQSDEKLDYVFGFVSDENMSDSFSNTMLDKAYHVVLLMEPEDIDQVLRQATSHFFGTLREYFPDVVSGDFQKDAKRHLEVAARDILLIWLLDYPI